MQIDLIKDINKFKELKEDWNLLYESTNSTIFQSFEFNYFSWKDELSFSELSNRLSIVVIRIEKKINTVYPFYIDNKRKLRFINDIHFDFCDIITRKSINFVIVYSYLKRKFDFKSMRLINVKKDSNIYNAINELNINNKLITSISQYSFLSVDQGIFPYNISHYRSKQKSRINNAYNKHKNKKHHILNNDINIFPMEEILLLKQRMIELSIRKEDFFTKQRMLLIEHLYNAGIIIISIIKEEDRVNAISFILKDSSNEFVFWIDLFDDTQMINIFNYINFIKTISLDRSIVLNFGRGFYSYKVFNFVPEFYELYGVYIFPNRFQKLRFIVFKKLKGFIKLILKKLKK